MEGHLHGVEVLFLRNVLAAISIVRHTGEPGSHVCATGCDIL